MGYKHNSPKFRKASEKARKRLVITLLEGVTIDRCQARKTISCDVALLLAPTCRKDQFKPN